MDKGLENNAAEGAGEELRRLRASVDEMSSMIALLDRAPIGLVEVSTDGAVVAANHLARALLAQSDLVGCTFEDFIHPDVSDTWDTLWRRMLAGETPQAETLQVQLSAGRTRFLRFTFDREGSHWYLWIEDRSEHRALSTQLTRDTGPERHLLHDLNNALTSGIGLVDVIQLQLEGRTALTGKTLDTLRDHIALVNQSLADTEALVSKSRRARHAAPSAVAAETPRHHILVVDDETAILELLVELFCEQFRVSTFSNAAHALRFFNGESSTIDVAIVDHKMPGVSGIGLASEMLATRADLPVILCTTDPELIAEQAAGRVQVERLLEKPIDLTRLRKMVESIVAPDDRPGAFRPASVEDS